MIDFTRDLGCFGLHQRAGTASATATAVGVGVGVGDVDAGVDVDVAADAAMNAGAVYADAAAVSAAEGADAAAATVAELEALQQQAGRRIPLPLRRHLPLQHRWTALLQAQQGHPWLQRAATCTRSRQSGRASTSHRAVPSGMAWAGYQGRREAVHPCVHPNPPPAARPGGGGRRS